MLWMYRLELQGAAISLRGEEPAGCAWQRPYVSSYVFQDDEFVSPAPLWVPGREAEGSGVCSTAPKWHWWQSSERKSLLLCFPQGDRHRLVHRSNPTGIWSSGCVCITFCFLPTLTDFSSFFFPTPNWATQTITASSTETTRLSILPIAKWCCPILVLHSFHYLIHKCLNRSLRDPNCVFLHNEITRSHMLLPSIILLHTLHKIQIGWLCMHAYFTFSTLLKKWIECWKGCFLYSQFRCWGP